MSHPRVDVPELPWPSAYASYACQLQPVAVPTVVAPACTLYSSHCTYCIRIAGSDLALLAASRSTCPPFAVAVQAARAARGAPMRSAALLDDLESKDDLAQRIVNSLAPESVVIRQRAAPGRRRAAARPLALHRRSRPAVGNLESPRHNVAEGWPDGRRAASTSSAYIDIILLDTRFRLVKHWLNVRTLIFGEGAKIRSISVRNRLNSVRAGSCACQPMHADCPTSPAHPKKPAPLGEGQAAVARQATGRTLGCLERDCLTCLELMLARDACLYVRMHA